MKLGIFTALFAQLSLDDVIKKIKPLGIQAVELGTGNYPGDPHLKLDWLNQPAKLKEVKQKLEDAGITISALSCHGNPLHPNKGIAKAHDETQRKNHPAGGETRRDAGSSTSPAARATPTIPSIPTG